MLLDWNKVDSGGVQFACRNSPGSHERLFSVTNDRKLNMRRAAGPGTRRRFQFTISCLIAIFVLCFVVASFQPALAEGAGSGSGGDSGVGGIVTHYLMSVGWVMGIVLGSVSVAMVFLIVLLFIDLRLGAAIPPGFVEEFTDTVNKRRFKEAYDLAKNDG